MKKAIIGGGGIAGLAAGWALALHGWRVQLHERSAEIREVGAGIYLMRNSVSIFEHHGIAQRILRNGVILTASERRDRNGRLIQSRRLPADNPWYVLPRYDLVQGLADAAREAGVEVICNSQLTGITKDGGAQDASGQVYQADLVIAADGFRSRLRHGLGLDGVIAERSAGATRLLIPREGRALVMSEYWSGRRRVGITPCSPSLTYAYLSAPNDDARGAALPLDRASWSESFPALRDFFANIPENTEMVRHAYPYARPTGWTLGRAALLGDAAHALPPTLAQGAGLAITNGYALAAILAAHEDVAAGLQAWEAQYRWIANQTQDWSARLDTITTRWPAGLSGLRRGALWLIGATLNDRVRVADRVRVIPAGSAGAMPPDQG